MKENRNPKCACSCVCVCVKETERRGEMGLYKVSHWPVALYFPKPFLLH